MRKKILMVAVIALVVFALAGCGNQSSSPSTGSDEGATGNQGQTYTMKVGYATINDTQDHAGHVFKEKVEAATGGRLKVELYPGSQLGTNQKIVDSLQTGTIEATLQPTAFLGGFAPVLTTGDLPFLWPDQYVMLDILNNTPIGEEFMSAAEDKGVKILWFFNEGTKHITTNFPVDSVDDLKGKKFRVMGAPVLADMMTYWRASAVPLAFSEIYTALQQGTVDGIEQTLELTYLNKYYEAAPYIFLSAHGLLPTALMVNARWYDGLPQDIQDAIREAAHASTEEVEKWTDEKNAEALELMKQDPKVQVTTPDPATIDAFKEAVMPLYDKFVQDVPQAEKFVKGFQDEVAKRTSQQ